MCETAGASSPPWHLPIPAATAAKHPCCAVGCLAIRQPADQETPSEENEGAARIIGQGWQAINKSKTSRKGGLACPLTGQQHSLSLTAHPLCQRCIVVDQPLPIFLQQLAGGLGVLGLLQAGPAACEWQRSILKEGMGTSAAAAAASLSCHSRRQAGGEEAIPAVVPLLEVSRQASSPLLQHTPPTLDTPTHTFFTMANSALRCCKATWFSVRATSSCCCRSSATAARCSAPAASPCAAARCCRSSAASTSCDQQCGWV